MSTPPRVFISYSHDSPPHKQWVLKLASDLRANGVDVVIDQWDLSPGDDIPAFMEQGLKTAERVVVVCSEKYVERANNGQGGVGYEKMIVTAELVGNLGTKKFIPIIRGSGKPPVPTFLGYRLYIDFEDDAKYPSSLETLVRELLNVPDPGKPPVGPNPFDGEGKGKIVVGAANPVPPATNASPDQVASPSDDEIEPMVAKLKSLITTPSHEWNLHDLVVLVANEARSKIEQSVIVDYAVPPTSEELVRRVAIADQATNKLAHLFAVGCHWANTEQAKTFSKSLLRVLIVPNPQGTFYKAWEDVARYPALRVAYAGGIAACGNDSFGVLRQLLVDSRARVRNQEPEAPLVTVFHNAAGFTQRYWQWLPGRERHFVPVSDYLEESLRPALRQIASDEEEIAVNFDRFEFFQAMIYGDVSPETSDRFWAPLGTFMWRRRDLFERTQQEIERFGKSWKPIQEGLFSGSPERATEILSKLQEFASRVRGQLGIW